MCKVCIKGLFLPPLRPKTENYLSPISFDWFIRRITEVLNFGVYSSFTVAMATQMTVKIGKKQRNRNFGPNLRFFETDSLRTRYQHR